MLAALLLYLFLSLDTTTSDICHRALSNENIPEPGPEPVTQSPKSSLNLAGLKAAFSSHHSSNSGNKSSVANSGPKQKTMQSFFKGSAKPTDCTPSVKSPSKSTKTKCSLVGKSVLDGFRYGTVLKDTDSEKDSTVSSRDVTGASGDIQHSDPEFSHPEPLADGPTVKHETFEEAADNSHAVPEDAELHTEPRHLVEDRTASPEAKRARTEKPHSPTKSKSNTFSDHFDKSSLTVDAPVCIQKRSVPLQFSLQELALRMKRLQDQRAQSAGDGLRYRRFKARINPGENQSAEEELKKEIR